jgi:hypothetical protein
VHRGILAPAKRRDRPCCDASWGLEVRPIVSTFRLGRRTGFVHLERDLLANPSNLADSAAQRIEITRSARITSSSGTVLEGARDEAAA